MDENVLIDFPRNFSYEENYHQKYFYPKLVLQRLRNRVDDPQSHMEFGSQDLSFTALVDESLTSCDDVCGPVIGSNMDPAAGFGRDLSGLGDRVISSSSEDVSFNACRYRDSVMNVIFDDLKTFSKRINDVITAKADQECSEEYDSHQLGNALNVRTDSELEEDITRFLLQPQGRKKRASSLRSVSTMRSLSSGTKIASVFSPIRKKSVRFADALGLELTACRNVSNFDQPPRLSQSVWRDLRPGVEEASKSIGTKHMSLCFQQPGESPEFLSRVERDGVALETCTVGPLDATVNGTVRASNLCYRKEVKLRCTMNDWLTFDDIQASYVMGSNDGRTDRFAFTITLPMRISVGSRLRFAVKFTALDIHQTFWDNNGSMNYQVECCAKVVPICESDTAWMHFL